MDSIWTTIWNTRFQTKTAFLQLLLSSSNLLFSVVLRITGNDFDVFKGLEPETAEIKWYAENQPLISLSTCKPIRHHSINAIVFPFPQSSNYPQHCTKLWFYFVHLLCNGKKSLSIASLSNRKTFKVFRVQVCSSFCLPFIAVCPI